LNIAARKIVEMSGMDAGLFLAVTEDGRNTTLT
jgi:hypothetical protein